jgi:copper(I)-binding protein
MGDARLVTWRMMVAGMTLAACSRDAGVTVSSGYAFAPVSGASMAAYVTLVNRGRLGDTLVSLTSPLGSAAVHQQREMAGMVHMEPVGPIAIAPGDSLMLAPGGRHVMLELSSSTPTVGDSVPLTLHLARGGEVTIRIPVRAYGDAP